MSDTEGKDLRSKSESNRKRQNPDLRSSSSYKRERKMLRNGEIERNATPFRGHTALYDLPFDVLDMILQKSYLHWILNSPKKYRDEGVIRSLISVDVCFYRRITRKRFKKAIFRYLKDFYGKTRKGSAIIKNNRNYILENIQLIDELIASLLYHNCITQKQSHFIQRQRSNQDKNAELLYVAESFDKAKFSNFVKCLRQTDQNTVARIMENGGGTTKIQLQSRGAKCTASTESQQLLLHKKIEDLRNGTKSWSHETYKFMSQLKEEGIEILNSQLDRRTVVVWIWCRSQAALEYIQKLYESNQLIDVFFENIQPSTSNIINIDENQFKETIVVCAFSISFTQRIKIQENKIVTMCGVTKLQNEIYILFTSSSIFPRPHCAVIHVFEDQNPFHWQKKIKLTKIKNPLDIRSNEKENCLYVIEYNKTSVWRITREGDGRNKIIKWLTTYYLPQRVSVSNDGQFMAFNTSSSFLKIHGSDAKLIRSIRFPRDIRDPPHAVKTSIGNYIILHRCIKENGENESNRFAPVIKFDICELSRDGQIVRHFIPSDETQQLKCSEYISIDSEDRVFVADSVNGRVILLDSDLKWNRILIPTGEKEETRIHWPSRLCYDEEKNQLIVAGRQVNVYFLSWK